MIHGQNDRISILLAPQAMTNDATVTANFDTKGTVGKGWHAEIITLFAAEVSTNVVGPTIALTESDDTVVTNFATFDAAVTRVAEDISDAAGTPVRYSVDLRGRKRYLRLSVTSGSHADDDYTLSAYGRLSRNAHDAGSATDAGDGVLVAV